MDVPVFIFFRIITQMFRESSCSHEIKQASLSDEACIFCRTCAPKVWRFCYVRFTDSLTFTPHTESATKEAWFLELIKDPATAEREFKQLEAHFIILFILFTKYRKVRQAVFHEVQNLAFSRVCEHRPPNSGNPCAGARIPREF
jgi:hypothetical protein